MQNTGKDISNGAGVVICTDDAWASIINQPTLSTGSQINLAKWSHQTL